MKRIDPILRQLRILAPQTRGALMRPARYFVAGSGVLTLGFEGFPDGFQDLKSQIGAYLSAENPGSTWPKITLAALNDARPLDDSELELLWEATSQADSILAAEARYWTVQALSAVEALTPSLELTGRSVELELAGPPDDRVGEEHAAYVKRVLDQWTRDPSPRYRARLRASGHGRDHYHRPCRAYSLVAYAPESFPGLSELRERLSRALPNRYHWFQPAARHLTVRSLQIPLRSERKAVKLFTQEDLDP